MGYAENARREIETITHAAERIQELESEEIDLLVELGKQGTALSQQRHQQAERMAAAVERELEDLQMSQTQFKVDFQVHSDPHGVPVEGGQRLAFDASGLEQVEFLIAPNPGEGLKPLAKIASGGETSRLMLALKNVLPKDDQIPTLISDIGLLALIAAGMGLFYQTPGVPYPSTSHREETVMINGRGLYYYDTGQ